MDALITIATFGQAHELAVVRARLEWEGIPCYLKDEFTVQAHPFYSNAIGGIKLQVARHDVAQAKAILVEAGVLESGPASEVREGMSGAKVLPFPRPAGMNPRKAKQLALALVALLLLSAILLM